MTFAQEAAKQGIELRRLRARIEAEVDQSRALGVTDNRSLLVHHLGSVAQLAQGEAQLAGLLGESKKH